MKKRGKSAFVSLKIKGDKVSVARAGGAQTILALLAIAVADTMNRSRKDGVTNEELVQEFSNNLRIILKENAPEKEAEHGAE